MRLMTHGRNRASRTITLCEVPATNAGRQRRGVTMGLLNYLRRIREEEREEQRQAVLRDIEHGTGMKTFPASDFKKDRVIDYCQIAEDAGYFADVLTPDEETQVRDAHER